jgi:SAM-dependent methyltransferase
MKSQYTQDVEFNSGFGALQTPIHMFTIAALCGIKAPRVDGPFRFLDLACGNGLTVSLLADAYPEGEFVGVDINPDHINKANGRAKRAGLSNVRFHESDLLDLAMDEFASFDYCAISGVYSWLDPERRDATRQLIKSIVRPGGLVYLDYSCQPGIAQVGPLYRILRELGETYSGTSADKLTAAARFLEEMRKDGARFFQIHQVAAARLKTILQNPAEDEAHEVFNLQENGFWSADVIADLDRSGFAYVGNAGLHHNLPTLSSQPETLAARHNFPVALQQMVFDVTWNVAQRRDVYVRHQDPALSGDLATILQDLPIYVLPGALAKEQRQKLSKHFPNYDFCSPAATEFARVAATAATFGELFSELNSDGGQIEKWTEIARHFLAARLVSVAAKPPADVGDVSDFQMGSSLNQIVLTDDIGEEYARPFASPVAGSRVLLPLKDRLYLWKLVGLDLGDAWDRLEHMQDVFRSDNNERLTRDGFINTIEASLPSFRKYAVPELLRLEILRPVPTLEH